MSVHAIHVSGDAPNMVSSVDPKFAHSDLTGHDQIVDSRPVKTAPAFLKQRRPTQHAPHTRRATREQHAIENAHTPTGTRVDATR